MARRRVKRSGKDRQGDITKLCGDFGSVSKTAAISEIRGNLNEYYVHEEGSSVDVQVVNGSSGPYLRTTADSSSKNNLDNLPDC